MRYLKMTLEYDGTNYYGWQRQPQAHRPTIQQVVEEVLTRVTGSPVKVTAAGRTDTGVHALGQVISFSTVSRIPLDKFPIAVNTRLPADIRVLSAEEVGPEFNARYSAKQKTYRYLIYNAPICSVFWRNYAAFIPYALEVPAMQETAQCFIGTHHFGGFCASGSAVKNLVRTVSRCEIWTRPPLIGLEITADGFLYHMVRNIVGTLLEVGRGKLSREEVLNIMASGDRTQAGPTAPAAGLYLVQVEY
ncbi:MAG: tRNA pseudouridine(38-40) synthase TruA [Firmicutes bacterium]|nr:tRNA pseudouridine(38-40) synthase TruA [Bacillota bacterium]